MIRGDCSLKICLKDLKNDKFKINKNQDSDLTATHNVFNKIKEDDANE